MAFYEVDFIARDTVESQLRDLFSTPKGTVILDPDYGLDFRLIDTDLGKTLDVQVLKEDIRNQLAKYVPRVNAKKAKIGLRYNIHSGNLAIIINDITVNLAENPNVPRVRTTE